MGITSPLQPVEQTSNGARWRPSTRRRRATDVRTTKAWTSSCSRCSCARRWRRRATRSRGDGRRAGRQQLFNSIGCATCHTRDDHHRGAGHADQRRRAQGAPARSATRSSSPFGDFLLHDIGTGDGIVQNGGQSTRNKVRTVPLWGLRARGRFMHDILSFSLTNAIQRHGNQADSARRAFDGLEPDGSATTAGLPAVALRSCN